MNFSLCHENRNYNAQTPFSLEYFGIITLGFPLAEIVKHVINRTSSIYLIQCAKRFSEIILIRDIYSRNIGMPNNVNVFGSNTAKVPTPYVFITSDILVEREHC